jgi:hypothetical protein
MAISGVDVQALTGFGRHRSTTPALEAVARCTLHKESWGMPAASAKKSGQPREGLPCETPFWGEETCFYLRPAPPKLEGSSQTFGDNMTKA